MRRITSGSLWQTNFRLNNDGEVIALFAPDGISPQDVVIFVPQFQNVSQGLFPDGAIGSARFMTNWTPRASNRLGLPASPQITAVAMEAGVIRLIIEATPARSYRVEFTDDLDARAWAPLGGARTATTEALALEVPVGTEPQRFFRVRLE